jgi:hypothetical protein
MSDNLPSQGMSIEDKTAFVDVKNLPVPVFMDHTFYGTEGYRTGAYLVPHPREVFYNTRRHSSYYKNFFRPIVRAMIDPVFSQEIVRSTDNDLFENFIENCDAAGTHINDFVKRAIYIARISGCAFVVMDNFKSSEQPDTVAQAAEQRTFPYVYIKKPQDVHSYTSNQFGKLDEITFFEKEITVGDKKVSLYRRWNATRWAVVEFKDKGEIIHASDVHGLGIIPVVPVLDFADTRNLSKLPDPPLYDLARLNFALFNKESEIRTMEQSQSFSILCIQGGSEPIALGPHNYLQIPADAHIEPKYISPDAQHLVNLVGNSEKLREDIYRIAQQNGVIGVRGNTSGVSKEWDFRAEENVLKVTAQAGRSLESNIADLFEKYIKTDFDYETQYPTQFSPTYDQDRIVGMLNAIDKLPPQEIMTELWRDFVQTFWKNNPDRIKAIGAVMDQQADDFKRSNAGTSDNEV